MRQTAGLGSWVPVSETHEMIADFLHDGRGKSKGDGCGLRPLRSL
jgi:hypothetical protein